MASRSANGKRNTSKRYSLEYKLQALELLKQNDGVITKTAMELKLSANTLTLWRKNFGNNMEEAERIEEIAKGVAGKIVDNKVTTLQEIQTAKKMILDRMKAIIPNETNLDRLQKTLKTLAEIDGTYKPPEGGDTPVNQNILLIDKLTQNFMNYEPKTPITIAGDTEE